MVRSRLPLSGIVLAREIAEGQTVASSFSTPNLFQIAEDLKKMQIEEVVSESDIGFVRSEQEVTFTVDAYEEIEFRGKVRQIRLNAIKEQNVVIYTVVIDINNPDLKLLPGMTALVAILIEERTREIGLRKAIGAEKKIYFGTVAF